MVASVVGEVKIAKQYVIYPNPTHSTAYISGFDILQIRVFTLDGQRIYDTKNQLLNLNGLAKGVYLIKVTTKNGTFIKKIRTETYICFNPLIKLLILMSGFFVDFTLFKRSRFIISS